MNSITAEPKKRGRPAKDQAPMANGQKPKATKSSGTAFEQAFRNIDDVLWKDSGCTSELDYTEQTSWILFLKYLDDLEETKYKSLPDATKQLGDIARIRETFVGFQRWLYAGR